MKTPNNQLSLFQSIYSSSIRRVIHEDIEYFSLIDIMAEFTDLKTRPDILWKRTKERMEKEGFSVGSSVIKLKLEATDGKKYLTECADGQTVLTVVLKIPSPKTKPIVEWLASLGYRALEEARNPELAVQRRQKELAKLQNAGYGQHPETLRLQDRDTNIEVFKSLKATISKLNDNPHWGSIINAEYKALFGMIARELEGALNTKSVRDSLPSVQMTWLTASERTLQDALKRHEHLTNDEIITIIEVVIKPIGDMLKSIMNAQGLDHVTGKPLLGTGE